MRRALHQCGLRHVYDCHEPVWRVHLGGVLSKEEENVGAVGGCNARVEEAWAGEGDVVGSESTSGGVDGQNVVLAEVSGRGGGRQRHRLRSTCVMRTSLPRALK